VSSLPRLSLLAGVSDGSYAAAVTAGPGYPTTAWRPESGWPALGSPLPGSGGPGNDNWKDDALCAETDPEAFFPEKGGSTREAKRVCRGCAVRDECLAYALGNDERFGIWGGLSERERRRLRQFSRGAELSA
jgi:WhiB family redox-sensing transcriptional regulator